MLISARMRQVFVCLLVVLLTGLFASHLHARTEAPKRSQESASGQRVASEAADREANGDARLNVRRQGSVEFVSGGVGDDEVREMRRVARSYPLQLTFAERRRGHDAFATDVQVTIRDQRGREVLDTVSEGPMLFVRLPVGRYRIEARYRDQVRKATVHLLSGKRRQVVIEWPAAKD